jgi:hypothetical protein
MYTICKVLYTFVAPNVAPNVAPAQILIDCQTRYKERF